MWAVDRPMAPTLIKEIMEGVNAKFRELVTQGYLIGGSCWYSEEASDHDGLLEIPPKGAVVRLWLCWSDTGAVDKGVYTLDETEHSGSPETFNIVHVPPTSTRA